jgi:outer membrane receptor protein involved in Fe transport
MEYGIPVKNAVVRAILIGVAAWVTMIGVLSAEVVMSAGPRQIEIPPQDLNSALTGLAAGFELQLLYHTDIVKGRKSPGAVGNLTPDQALGKVLQGTGLTYQFLDAKTVTIIPTVATTNAAEQQSASETRSPDNSRPAAGVSLESKGGNPDHSRRSGIGSTEESSQAEIVVTAEKRSERLQDVPVPISVISGAFLTVTNEVRMQDFYATVPGFAMSSGFHGEPFIAIRGITTDIYSNPSVAIAIDDVPFGSSTAIGGGNVAPDIDPNDLSRIEVLRGPQGTLYGANSIGGLIKYVTADPSTDKVSGRLQASTLGVYNGGELGYVLRASVNLPLSASWALRASGFSQLSPGFIDNLQSGARAVNRASTDGLQLSSMWRPSDTLSLKFTGLLQDSKVGGLSEVSQQGLRNLQQDVLPGTGRYDTKVQSYTASLSADLEGINLSALTGYNTHSTSAWFDDTPLYGSYTQSTFGLAGSSGDDRRHTDKFSQELRITVPIGQRLEWLIGGFYTHENSPFEQDYYAADPNTGVLGDSYAQASFSSRYLEYAAFTDLTVNISNGFDLQLGGRESLIKQTIAETLSGRLVGPTATTYGASDASAFTYLITPRFKVSPGLMIYARLASGYRPGGPNANAALHGLPSQYEPDKTRNYEMGVKGVAFEHAISFDASLYFIDWKNIQVPLSQNGFSYYANGSRATSKGMELSAQATPFDGLTISGWIAWANAVLTEALPVNSIKLGSTGDPLPNTPRLSGSLAVEQNFPLANHMTGFVGASLVYVGNRSGSFQPTVERQIFPAYSKLDARTGAKYNSWTMDVFVTNLADRRGILGGGLDTIPTTSFTVIQPRSVGLSVSKIF